jgi:hypothetical protein
MVLHKITMQTPLFGMILNATSHNFNRPHLRHRGGVLGSLVPHKITMQTPLFGRILNATSQNFIRLHLRHRDGVLGRARVVRRR